MLQSQDYSVLNLFDGSTFWKSFCVPIGASFLFIANMMFSRHWSTMSLNFSIFSFLKIGSVCALYFPLTMLLVAFLCIVSIFFISDYSLKILPTFVVSFSLEILDFEASFTQDDICNWK
jgi:hypothetical protein